MKQIALIFFFLCSTLSHSQRYINMTSEFSDIKGHLTIDGNALQVEFGTNEQIIITAHDLVMNDRSSFLFHNIIVQLSGAIILKGKRVKPVLMDSYIFCSNAGSLKSNFIIETDSYAKVNLSKVEYIKSLKGNPEILVYNSSGKRLFRGKKSETDTMRLPISRYDIKVVGLEFKNQILIYEE